MNINSRIFFGVVGILCTTILSSCNGYAKSEESIESTSDNKEIVNDVHVDASIDEEFKTAYDMICGEWINQEETVYLKIYEENGFYYISQNTSDTTLNVYSLKDYDIYDMRFVDSDNASEKTIEYSCNTELMQYNDRIIVSADKAWINIQQDILLYPYDGDIAIENYIYAGAIYEQIMKEFPEMKDMEFFLNTCKELTKRNINYVYSGHSEKEINGDAIVLSLVARTSLDLSDHNVKIYVDNEGTPISIESWEID